MLKIPYWQQHVLNPTAVNGMLYILRYSTDKRIFAAREVIPRGATTIRSPRIRVHNSLLKPHRKT